VAEAAAKLEAAEAELARAGDERTQCDSQLGRHKQEQEGLRKGAEVGQHRQACMLGCVC
jgi:chromosome segregation ATPase